MKHRRTNKKILLVSPEFWIRESIGDILLAHGFDVLLAETGQAAVRTMRGHMLDAILLDYRTPLAGKNSPMRLSRTLEAITNASPFLPLVLLCSTREKLQHATILMADMVLRYPVQAPTLLDALQTVLEETLRERALRKRGDIRGLRSYSL